MPQKSQTPKETFSLPQRPTNEAIVNDIDRKSCLTKLSTPLFRPNDLGVHSHQVVVDGVSLLALRFLYDPSPLAQFNPKAHQQNRAQYTHRLVHALSQLLFNSRTPLHTVSGRSPAACSFVAVSAPSINFLMPHSQKAKYCLILSRKIQHTQHRRHHSHAGILLMLVRTANSEVGNGLQADRVETGRNTLRRHIDGV